MRRAEQASVRSSVCVCVCVCCSSWYCACVCLREAVGRGGVRDASSVHTRGGKTGDGGVLVSGRRAGRREGRGGAGREKRVGRRESVGKITRAPTISMKRTFKYITYVNTNRTKAMVQNRGSV